MIAYSGKNSRKDNDMGPYKTMEEAQAVALATLELYGINRYFDVDEFIARVNNQDGVSSADLESLVLYTKELEKRVLELQKNNLS